ncbi:MAG: hypothetical protein M3R69_02795 [Acidobacteriota bacterium]|nr:hypothetical protein [Acidobacteriota bacterium]
MTHEELIKEIKLLSLEQQVELLEAISRSVREKLKPPEDRRAIVNRLRGIAKPDGPMPSDEELKEDYVRYLEEKYS